MGNMHSFDVEVAKDVGVNAAIMLQSIKWWCEKNRANDRHFHDGLWWTYNSTKALCELYPYLGKGAIGAALKKLEERGYIRTGNYNKSAYDRTKWYAITEKGLAIFGESIYQNQEIQLSFSGNPKGETGQPIPVTNQLESSSVSNKRAKAFVPPTLSDVETHVKDKGYHFDAKQFFEYYEASGWRFKNGKPVKNWKQCCVTWEGNVQGSARELGRGRNDEYNF